MNKLLKIGNSIFFVVSVFWLYFSVYYIFDFFKTDFTNLTLLDAKVLILLVVCIFICFHLKSHIASFLKKCINYLLYYKKISFLFLFIFQIFLILTSLGLASGDTTVLYELATDPIAAQASNYISVNPNNYLLFLWFKLNTSLFSENALVALAAWNALFIDLSIYYIYKTCRKLFDTQIGNIVYLLSFFVIGLQPQHIYTYSDPIALFLVSLFLYLVVLAVKKDSYYLSILSSLVFSLCYGFRVPTFIFIIAGMIVLIIEGLKKKRLSVRVIKKILLFFLIFIGFSSAITFSLNHQNLVAFEKNQSRTLLYYVDLGLTYNGSDHSDLPEEVVYATGEERNKTALDDINNRLEEYDLTGFVGHLSYKYYWMVNEGLFGWLRESVLREENLPTIPWLQRIQQSFIARLTRTYVYVRGENFYFYAIFFQLFWIVIALGLVLYAFHFSEENPYLLWMQISIFGAIMFLTIFEAGRSRYLIQFLPAIFIISSVGLSKLMVYFKIIKNYHCNNL